MNQKTVLVVLIIILSGLILFLGGYLSLENNSGSEGSASLSHSNLTRFQADGSTVSDQPDSSPKIRRLSTRPSAFPTISEDGKMAIFFEKDSGKVMTSDFAGHNLAVLFGQLTDRLTSAVWSTQGPQAITTQNVGSKTSNRYLNLKSGERILLSSAISSPVWSPDGQKIAYLFTDTATGKNSLSIANPDGSVFKNILSTRAEQIIMAWPQKNYLAFFNPSGSPQSLLWLDIEKESLEKIVDSVNSLKISWSADGHYLFYTYLDSLKNEKKAKILNLAKRTEEEVDFDTVADQCVWNASDSYLYCQGQFGAAQLDGLYRFNIKTKEKELVLASTPAQPFKISFPLLTPAEDYLVFLNQYDQHIYSISLF